MRGEMRIAGYRCLLAIAFLVMALLLMAETAFGQSIYLEREESRAKNTGGYDLNLYYDETSHVAHITAAGNLKDSLKAHEKFEHLKKNSTTWKISSEDTGIAEVSTPVKTTGTNGTFYYDLYPSTTLHIPTGYETQSAACIDKISGDEEVFEAKGFQAGQSGDYTLPIGGRTANWGISTDMIKSGLHYYYNMDLEYRITLRPKEYRLYLAPGQGIYQGSSGMKWQSVTYHDAAGNAPGPASCKGYRFDGWYTMDGTAVFDADGHWITGDYWDAAGRWIGTDALIVFARWTKTDDFSFSETVAGIELQDLVPDDSGSASIDFQLGDGEEIAFLGLEDGAMYQIEEAGNDGLRASCQLQAGGQAIRVQAKAGESLRTPTRVLSSDAAAAFVNAADDGTAGEEGGDAADQPLHDLAVRKEYDGVYDAASVRASFRVQLTGLAAGGTYTAQLCDDDGETIRSEAFTAAEDGSASYGFSLRDSQSMQLLVLPASARYQIIEEADAKAAPSYVLTSEETAGVRSTEGQAKKGEPLSTPVESLGADRSYSFYNCIETQPVKTVRNEAAAAGKEATGSAAGALTAGSSDAGNASEGAGEAAAEERQNRVEAREDAWIYHIHQEVEVPARSFCVYDTLPPYVRIIGLPGSGGQARAGERSSDRGTDAPAGNAALRSCGLRALWSSPDGSAVIGGEVTERDARTGEYLIRGASGAEADAVLFRIRYDEDDGAEITLRVTAEEESMMLEGGSFDLYFLAGISPEASHDQLVAADCYHNGNYRFVNEASTVISGYLCTSQPVTTRVPGPATSHDLVLQKNVTGDLGDRIKAFAFQVDFTGLTPGARYETPASEAMVALPAAEAVQSEDPAGRENEPAGKANEPAGSVVAARCIPFTADAGGAASLSVTLRDGEAAVFPGLPQGAGYQIREATSDHAPSYRQQRMTAEETAQWTAGLAEETSAATGGSTDDVAEWLEGEDEEFRQDYTGDAEDQPFFRSEDAAGRAGQPLETAKERACGDAGETILVAFTNHRSLATVTGVMGGRTVWPVAAVLAFAGGSWWVRAGRRRRTLLLGTVQENLPETTAAGRRRRVFRMRR